MTAIDNIYSLIAEHIKETSQLRDLARLLDAEAERREQASTTTDAAAAWPFPPRNRFFDMLTKALEDGEL